MLLVLPPPSQPAPGAGRANLNGRARAPCASFVDARCFSPGCLPASSPAARPLPRPTALLPPAMPPRRPHAPPPAPGYRETPPRACAARAMRRGPVLAARGGGGGGRAEERARQGEWRAGRAGRRAGRGGAGSASQEAAQEGSKAVEEAPRWGRQPRK